MTDVSPKLVALIAVGPLIVFGCLYGCIIFGNIKTSGEIKHILPPEMFLKALTVISMVSTISVLGILKILNPESISALIGAIGAGILGVKLSENK